MTRDSNGRFVKGNRGGPGRPKRKVEQEYGTTLRETVTLEDWAAICQRAVTDAKAGDRWARAWLGQFLVEPPTPVDPNSLPQQSAEEMLARFKQIEEHQREAGAEAAESERQAAPP